MDMIPVKSLIDESSAPGGGTEAFDVPPHDDFREILTHVVALGVQDLSSEIHVVDEEPVALGIYSSIWSGKWRNKIRVAVKLLDRPQNEASKKEINEVFLREAQIWSQAARHENIVPLLGVARHIDSVALISPWMEGNSLRIYVETHPDAKFYELFADMGRGLAYLHSQGIVYGNVSPSTVLVSSTGRAYLSSFLFAHYQDAKDAPNILFDRCAIPPEYLEMDGVEASTPQSDVFEFGTTALEITVEGFPHMIDVMILKEFLQGTISERPKFMKGLTNAFWTLVCDCWQGDPTRRPTMTQVAHTLVQLSEMTFPPPECDVTHLKASPRELKNISNEIQKIGEHPIAGGGFCDLYLGERLGSEKVALKLVRLLGLTDRDKATARRHILNEAHLWAEFQHPRILEFYGICDHGDLAVFMVSPFLQNGNIMRYLENINPDADRHRLLSEAAEGLFYLHSHDIVHGDLKGANILIADMGSAVLADFGLSRISYEATTTTLQGAGSTRWMAPELVLAGDNPIGPLKTKKSDIYAYGHVVLEVLSNMLPFYNLKEELHVLVRLIRGERSLRPNGVVADTWLDDAAWELSRRCTAIDPKKRLTINMVVFELHRLREVRCIGQE